MGQIAIYSYIVFFFFFSSSSSSSYDNDSNICTFLIFAGIIVLL